ncbi:MAG: hypothetical protein SFT81_07710 [Candidatus Caenarcaniphilales bacterium]|nr:hypothetical protein [Candidatus Caenarcaniphilales bacterium]
MNLLYKIIKMLDMNKLETSLTQLCDTNSKLLEALKGNNQSTFPELLDRRTALSTEIQKLCEGEDLKLQETNEGIMSKTQQVIEQDRELMIYLERQIQRLRGNYSRLIMNAQNKTHKS